MKTNIKILGLILVLLITPVIFPKTVSAQQGEISFQVFYDELSPYGEWVDYPRYGYVWIPDAGPDFMPYSTQGQWIYTDYGWTWVSNYEWGWAPFHYGRWDYDNYYGWLWVPDNQWGPSWVTWVRSDDYYGWQPMQPGISISLSFGRDYRSDYNHWTFVRDRDFERPDIQRYYIDRSDNSRIIQNYTVINQTYIDRSRNTTYISGPAREDVQRVTGKKIRPVAIRENERPGQRLNNKQLEIYRPNIRNNQESGEQRAAPKRITDIKEVKQPSERNAPNQQRTVSPSGNERRERQPNNVRQQNTDQINQPRQQKDVVNPSENQSKKQRQQKEVTQPENRRSQPSNPQNVNPTENRRREKSQQKEVTQPENRISQPAKQQNANPSENIRQQDNRLRKQNDKNNAPQQNQNVKQPENNSKERQPVQAKQPTNERKVVQPTQQKVKQSGNTSRQERRANTVKQQNTAKQQNAVKQQNAKRNRQEKAREDKK